MTTAATEKTPEELELEAQEEDKKKAEEEDKASKEKMKNPKGPYTNIRRFRGVGPLVVKSRRGEIKAFSGDIIATVVADAKAGETPEQKKARESKAEDMVFTEDQFCLMSGIDAKDLPDTVEDRALRIGEERRAKAAKTAEKPAPAPTK